MIRFRFIELFSNYTIYSKQNLDNENSHTNPFYSNIKTAGKNKSIFFLYYLNPKMIKKKLPSVGIEPTTPRLEVWCAIQLRHEGKQLALYFFIK